MLKQVSSIAFALGFVWMDAAMALELVSSEFQQGVKIPKRFTCDGDNVSPPLAFKGVPAGTQSLALVMEDPDAPAGTWDHWILYNIPAHATELKENFQAQPGVGFGQNSWHHFSYEGPCPADREHRYFFKLYALNTILPATAGLTKEQLSQAIQGHVIATAELMTKYQRTGPVS